MTTLGCMFRKEFDTTHKILNLCYLFFKYIDWNHIITCIETIKDPLTCMRKIDPCLRTQKIMEMLLLYRQRIPKNRVDIIIMKIDPRQLKLNYIESYDSNIQLLIIKGINVICQSKTIENAKKNCEKGIGDVFNHSSIFSIT